MRVNEFMSLVLDRTTALLPAELRGFTARNRFVWLQLHYHSPNVHYEVWLARKTGRIEIGLLHESPHPYIGVRHSTPFLLRAAKSPTKGDLSRLAGDAEHSHLEQAGSWRRSYPSRYPAT